MKCFFIFIFFLFFSSIFPQEEIPIRKGPITDTTGKLSSSFLNKINKKLSDFSIDYGHQLGVLVVGNIGDLTPLDYSMKVLEKWKLGREGIDDGVLLLIVTEQKRIRIDVGYGLEPILTDAHCKRIISDTIKPQLKKGNLEKAIDLGTDAILSQIQDPDKLSTPPSNKKKVSSISDRMNFHKSAFILSVILLIPIIFSITQSGISGLHFIQLFSILVFLITSFFTSLITAFIFALFVFIILYIIYKFSQSNQYGNHYYSNDDDDDPRYYGGGGIGGGFFGGGNSGYGGDSSSSSDYGSDSGGDFGGGGSDD